MRVPQGALPVFAGNFHIRLHHLHEELLDLRAGGERGIVAQLLNGGAFEWELPAIREGRDQRRTEVAQEPTHKADDDGTIPLMGYQADDKRGQIHNRASLPRMSRRWRLLSSRKEIKRLSDDLRSADKLRIPRFRLV